MLINIQSTYSSGNCSRLITIISNARDSLLIQFANNKSAPMRVKDNLGIEILFHLKKNLFTYYFVNEK